MSEPRNPSERFAGDTSRTRRSAGTYAQFQSTLIGALGSLGSMFGNGHPWRFPGSLPLRLSIKLLLASRSMLLAFSADARSQSGPSEYFSAGKRTIVL